MFWHFKWFLLLFGVWLIGQTSGQLAELSQAVSSIQTMVPGVKNILSGILSVDKVHNKCMQMTLCEAFSGKLVENKVEFDPVKRSEVVVQKVIREEGKLRWIGDLFVNFFKSIGKRIGIDRMFSYYDNRRQIGAPNPIVVQAISFVSQMVKQIPAKHVHNVMNTLVDYTDIMDTEGPVYPFIRSATLGYGYGDEVDDRDGDFEGVCKNLGNKCPDSMWDHLETANTDYSTRIGKISERNSAPSNDLVRQRLAEGQQPDYNTWNFMEPKDLLNPRIFLCKTGRFINNFVANNLGKSSDNGEDEGRMKKEPFVNENFENSCEEKDLETIHADLSDLEGSGSGSGKDDCVDFTDEDQDAIIQSNPDLVTYNNCKQPQETEETTEDPIEDVKERSGDEFPVLVFEGLERPQSGQSEEDLVAKYLEKSNNLTALAVRRAVRLPFLQEGSNKSVVLVELDTMEHEKQILEDEERAVEMQRQIEIRQAKFQELWRFVADLTVVKRLAVVPEAENVILDEPTGHFKIPNINESLPSATSVTSSPQTVSTIPTTSLNSKETEVISSKNQIDVKKKRRRFFWWF